MKSRDHSALRLRGGMANNICKKESVGGDGGGVGGGVMVCSVEDRDEFHRVVQVAGARSNRVRVTPFFKTSVETHLFTKLVTLLAALIDEKAIVASIINMCGAVGGSRSENKRGKLLFNSCSSAG